MNKVITVVVIVTLIIYYAYSKYADNKAAEENIKLGAEYLKKNLENDGVEQTTSGLQYKVLTPGEGTIHPKASDKVTVHYHGTMIDGTVFDSSVEREQSATFPLNRVIAGWTEGVQLMVVGEKTRFFIPSSLAYKNRSAGKIPPGSVLIFDVELLAIN